jgi:hypothetical protein
MKKVDLENFAREAAKGIKTEQDLNDFRAMLTKVRDCSIFCVRLDLYTQFFIQRPQHNADFRKFP